MCVRASIAASVQTVVKKLVDWLKSWEAGYAAELAAAADKKAGAGAGAGAGGASAASKKAKFKHAALLSGPPGIGKTTTAHVVARSLGYDVFELNASDARGRNVLKASLAPVLGTRVLNFSSGPRSQSAAVTAARGVDAFASGGGSSSGGGGGGDDLAASRMAGFAASKRVIVMDEVDGMSTGDFGGNAELIAIIKRSSTPIICVCNDRQKESVRSLADSCYDLKFAAPEAAKVAARVVKIAAAEGLRVDAAAAEALVSSSNGDIRQVLNALMMWSAGGRVPRGVGAAAGAGGSSGGSGSVSADQVAARMGQIHKDDSLRLTAMDAVQRLFNPELVPFNDRSDNFFVDYDMIPLLLHMLYPHTLQAGSSRMSDNMRLLRLQRSAEDFSAADIVTRRIRSDQDWKLLPIAAALNTDAAIAAAGPVAPNLSKFPE
jgi:replication factor C subunit 1